MKRPSTRRARRRGRRRLQAHRFRLTRLEKLESRCLLAVVTWDGGGNGTDWNDPLNWSTDSLPTAADDVTISLPSSDPTIRIATADVSIQSLVVDETLRIENGRTLQVSGSADVNATLLLDGARLQSGNWDTSGGSLSFTATTNTLEGLTLLQPLVVTSGGRVELTGGTSYPSVTLNSGKLGFEPGTSLPGDIRVDGNAASYLYVVGTGTLTIPAGRTIDVGAGATIYLAQSPDIALGQDRSDVVINSGTIQTTSGTIEITAYEFYNETTGLTTTTDGNVVLRSRRTFNRAGGVIRAGTGSIQLVKTESDTRLDNDGTIEVHGGTLDTQVWWFDSTGVLILDNATTYFGGRATTQELGLTPTRFQRTGGTFYWSGVLSIVGTLTFGSTTGTWIASGADFRGGTIRFDPGYQLLLNHDTIFNGVTIGDEWVIDGGGRAFVYPNTTFPSVRFVAGKIEYPNWYSGDVVIPSITIAAGGWGSMVARNDIIVPAGTSVTLESGSQFGIGPVLNRGTIQSTAADLSISDALLNDTTGQILVEDGDASFQSVTSIQNDGLIRVRNGRFFTGGEWKPSTGTLILDNTVAHFSSNTTVANLGLMTSRFQRTGGYFLLYGTLDIVDPAGNPTTLVIDARTGDLGLLSGTVRNGAIRQASGYRLVPYRSTGVLDNVDVLDELFVDQGDVTLVNGSTYARARLQNGVMIFGANTPLSGDIEATGGTYSHVFPASQGDLIIPVGRRVYTSAGGKLNFFRDYYTEFGRVVNNGIIEATGGDINLRGLDNQDGGIVRATNGNTLYLRDDPYNFSAQTLTGGTWIAESGGIIEFPMESVFRTNAATLQLRGPVAQFRNAGILHDFLRSLKVNESGGSITIADGRTFSPIEFENRGTLIVSASTLNARARLRNSGTIDVRDGGTMSVTAFSPAELPLRQYADRFVAASSSYSWYSETAVLGEPDASGSYPELPHARRSWFPSAKNGTRETLTVDFAEAVYASGVTVREVSGNGFVRLIEVRNAATGQFASVFSGTDTTPPGFNDLVVTFPQTAYLVDAVRITIDTDNDPGQYEGINAVQLHGMVAQNSGTYTQTAGRTVVNTTLTVPAGLELQGGILEGSGDVIGDVHNTGGTVSPGASPGVMDIQGNYVQGSGGQLLLEIAGRNPDIPEYDRLRVTGTMTVDGSVDVSLLGGFEPAPGDEFSVLTGALRLGEFTDYNLPSPGGSGRRLGALYSGTGLKLQNEIIPPLEFVTATTSADPSGIVTPRQIVFDQLGNNYVVGSFQGTVDFDREHSVAGDTLTSSGTDGYIASFDPSGRLRWVYPLEGSGNTEGTDLTIAPAGPGASELLYATGTFGGSLAYRGTSVTGRSENAFVLRVDTSGGLSGLAALPTGATSRGAGVSVAANGNAVVSGRFSGTLLTTPVTLTSAGADDGFVLEYQFGSGVVRAGRLGGANSDTAADVAVDSTDAVWLVGRFSGTTSGLATLTASGDAAFGRSDAFAVKLMPFGTGYSLATAQRFGSDGDDEAIAVTIGPNDEVIVGGTFELSPDFDVDPNTAFALRSNGDRDTFLVKLLSDGTFQWARNVGGYREEQLSDLSVDSAGHIYVTGEFRDRVDFDPLDGIYLLETSTPATPEAFVVKLDDAGEFLWATQLGNQAGAESWGGGVTVSRSNRVGVTASFRQSIDVDPTDGVVLRTFAAGNASARAGVIALLDQKGIPEVSLVGVPSDIVDEGSELGLGVSVTDDDSTYFTYSWTVTRNGQPHLTGDQAALAMRLEDEGVYRIEVTVRDESGNRDSAEATIVARNVGPVWQPTQYSPAGALLTGGSLGNVDAGESFGTSLSIGGDYVLIGAPGGNEAWLYDPAETTAARQIKEFIAAPAGTPANARFGHAVLNLGELLVIGAPQAGAGGSVYVYQWDPATGPLDEAVRNFQLVRTITAPNGQAGDRFGESLAALGDLVVIGAPGRTTPVGGNVGEAYLVDPRSGSLLETFANPTPGVDDEFAASVAVADGAVLIGAPGDDRAGTDTGVAHLFDPNTGKTILEILNPTPASGERFGATLSTTTGLALIGDPADAGGEGAVHLFDLSADSANRGEWLATIANPGTPLSQFGSAIDAWGARAAIGAPLDGLSVTDSGTVFLLDIDPDSPRFGEVLDSVKASAPAAGDRFGAAVALSKEGKLLVGAPQADTAATDGGAAYRLLPSSRLLLSSSAISEGDTIELYGAFFDPGGSDSHTLLVDWSDGSTIQRIPLDPGTTSFTALHRYMDDGVSGTASDDLTIRLRLQDDTGDVLATRTSDDTVLRFGGTTLEDLGALVSSGAGGLNDPAGITVGPDGDIYVSNGATGTNPVLRYSGLSGGFLSVFLPAGVQGTTRATDMTFGPDGNLYYLDGPNRRVLRFDGGSGAFIDEFVAPGSGGLSDPRGLAFGPDGHLYIASFGNDAIFRYDGSSGAPIDRFLGNTEGIVAPVDLAFGDDGDLFVLNSGPSAAVVRYDSTSGTSLGVVVEPTLSSPAGYLLVASGAVWVSDPAGMLQRFPLNAGGYEAQYGSLSGALAWLPIPADTTTTITIANTPPEVDVVSAFNATANQYTFAAQVNDRGTPDTFTFAWSATGATIVGPADQPQVTVSAGSSGFSIQLTVTDDDTGTSTYETQVIVGTAGDDSLTVTNPPPNIQKTIVFGLDGNDTLDASAVTAVPVELIGGTGNDTLTGGGQSDYLIGNNPGDYQTAGGGDHGNDILIGNQGDDILDGGLGNDTLVGGVGNDTYIQVPGSADVLIEDGGSGIDTIDYALAYYGITFDLSVTGVAQVVNPTVPIANQDTVEIRGVFENIRGSSFSDTLKGNTLPNVLIGGGGDDTLFGGDTTNPDVNDGNDTLVGGAGNDTLIAGAGNDVIYGGDQSDPNAPDGNDTLVGGDGSDTLIGGAGDDVIYGGDQTDANAPDGNDTLVGGDGSDTLIGGAGDDVIYGGDQTDPGAPDGNDTLVGGDGNDTLIAGSGDDVIYGGDQTNPNAPDGNDTLVGGDGSDTLIGGAGDDVIYGGDQTDPNAPDGNDTLVGGDGNDTLIGGAGDDVIYGGDQTDPAAPDGNDTLAGGDGNDTLIGGAGDDVIYGGDQTDPGAPDGNDTLVGGDGSDTLIGGAGDDVIYGGDQTDPGAPDGNDLLQGGEGSDTLIGGAGDDVIYGGDQTDPNAPDGDDTLVGGDGDDTLIAGAGDDVIYGGDQTDPNAPDGNDTLKGNDGNDTLIAGAGDDVIFGGAGDDLLTGGTGTDVFEGGSGIDRIVEIRDADITMLPTTLVIAGESTEIHYDIEEVGLGGGPSANTLDASAFSGPAVLAGFDGDDTLLGTRYNDQLDGGGGNDLLNAGDGDDVVEGGPGSDTLDGGAGNDTYVQQPGSRDVLSDAAGIDWIDLGTASLPVTLDLGVSADQTVDSAGNILKLSGTFENVRATSFNDTIVGNSERNILAGGGGIDLLDGGPGADIVQGSFTQVVYLDFDSATGPGEKFYSIEERNAIEARLQALFGFPFSVSFTQTRPAIGSYATITVNAGGSDENEVLAGGVARELDWRNFNPGSIAAVNVNAFLGKRGQPAASSDNYVAMTSTVIAHEVGHLLGLRHSDAFGPIGTNPVTGLAYGTFSGLIDKSVSHNEWVFGNALAASAAPYPYEFRFANSPVLLQPVIQAGNTQANPFSAPTGTVYDAGTTVATFSIDGNGAVQLTSVGAPRIASATFDAAAGVLTLQWNARPQSPRIVTTYYYDAMRPGYRGPDDAFETPRHVMASPASVGSRIDDTMSDAYLSERSLIKLAFADASTTLQETDLPTVSAPAGLGSTARDLGALVPIAVPNLLPPDATNSGKFLQVRALNTVGTIGLTPSGTSENDVYAFSGVQGEWVTIEVLSAVLEHRLSDEIDAVVQLYDSSGNAVSYYGQPAVSDDGISSQDPLLLDVPLPATGTYYVVVDTFAGGNVPDTDTGQYELFLYKYSISNDTRLGGAGDTLVGGPGPDILIGSAGDDIFRGDTTEDAFVGLSPFDISNRPPVAADDSLATDEHTAASINVLANDSDPDAGDDPSTFSLDSIDSIVVSGLSSGTSLTTGSVTETSEGVLVFRPGSDFEELPLGSQATVAVGYTMSDDEGLSSSATLMITVTGVNDAPTAQNVAGSATEDGSPVTLSFAGDDADRDDTKSSLTYTIVGNPAEGAVTNNGDGTFRFDPAGAFQDLASGETRTVTFGYKATDRHGTDSSAATVTVTVVGSNDTPEITQLTSPQGTPCTASSDGRVTLSGAFTDADASDTHAVTVDWGDGSAIETLSNVDAATRTFSATHAFSAGGIYRAQVKVDDGKGGVSETTIRLAVQGIGKVGRTLFVVGTGGRDKVHIRHNVDGEEIRVRAWFDIAEDDENHHDDDSATGGTLKTFAAGGINKAIVYGCDGADHLHVRTINRSDGSTRSPIGVRLLGGKGDDVLIGGGGNDTLRGGGGKDHIHGGAGNDFIFGGTGDDWIDAGRGKDRVAGGKGNDHIHGGGGNDVILGGAGVDHIDGKGGRDLIIGGLGSDKLEGGPGQDLLVAGTTDYDADWSALDRIFAEWTSSRDYATRIGNIRTGSGSLAGSGISLKKSTVKKDGGEDILEGDDGLDAFFYNFDGTGVYDRATDFRHRSNEQNEVRVDEG